MEDLKKINQNSQITNEKITQLQKQVCCFCSLLSLFLRSEKQYCAFRYNKTGSNKSFLYLRIFFFFFPQQLEEANDLLRTESDTAARLRKGNTEMSKSLSQVESLNRELQERCRVLEGAKLQVEKDYYQLQAALESERRDRSHGSEMIGELQGKFSLFILCSFFFF